MWQFEQRHRQKSYNYYKTRIYRNLSSVDRKNSWLTTTLLSYRIFYLLCDTSLSILQSLLYGSLANRLV